MFTIYDIDGNEIRCEVLFNFSKNNKNFLVYLDENKEILASFYEIKGDDIIIYPIEDDSDFDIVDREIAIRRGINES